MEIVNKRLYIFTNSFPYSHEESFLYNEVLFLATKFKAIEIFPMYFTQKELAYSLPDNVSVGHYNMFQPYNRVKCVLSNFGLIAGIYLAEIFSGRSGTRTLRQFMPSLNNLMHKIHNSKQLAQKLTLNQQTICYTYWFSQWTFILSLIKNQGKPMRLFTRIHGADVYEEQHTEKNFFFPFRKFQLKQIDRVIAISQSGKKHLETVNDLDRSKVLVSRLGVKDHGLNPDGEGFRIVSCSAFQRYKRVHFIIDILKEINANVEWVHFGDGELKDSILRRSKELPQNITFNWMGQKSNDSIMQFYKNEHVDLFINVSETEGIPVSIMEAISFGIPSIATNVGGVSEIVNKDTGYLIDKNFNCADVAKMIEGHLQLSKEQVSNMRRTAREFWSRNFAAEKNYNELLKVLLS